MGYWLRGVMFLDVAIVPLFVVGGTYGSRAWHVAAFGLIGAGLTALGFGIGGQARGWLALVAFAVTLVAGLAAVFGTRRSVNALLLNIWFVIALAVEFGYHHGARSVTSRVWPAGETHRREAPGNVGHP